jgi:ornithine cyclodeaminase/alanine dehydrogenase-like protein (mu-crystallin family)
LDHQGENIMSQLATLDTLRVGFVGTGFIAAFHLQSMLGVRNLQVTGVYSRSEERRRSIAERANELVLGPAKP